MLVSWLFFILGLAILSFGAEFMVRGSGTLALKLGISPLVIDLTLRDIVQDSVAYMNKKYNS